MRLDEYTLAKWRLIDVLPVPPVPIVRLRLVVRLPTVRVTCRVDRLARHAILPEPREFRDRLAPYRLATVGEYADDEHEENDKGEHNWSRKMGEHVRCATLHGSKNGARMAKLAHEKASMTFNS